MAHEHFDVIIIGSGPAGLFAAIQLERLGIKRLAVIDKNPYPAGGLLNDGKLNFDYRIGIDLAELSVNQDSARDLIKEVKEIFVGFPQCRQVTAAGMNDRIESLKNIAEDNGVEFIAPEQWHWGTDNGKAVVDYLRNFLTFTTLITGAEVLSIEKATCGFCIQTAPKATYSANVILAAPGRSGAYWFRDMADMLGITHTFGPIDVGIRFELQNKFYDAVTEIVYDPKFIFRTARHNDRVRTFCTNPGGRVRTEHYFNFKLVNGDAFSTRKTGNTNFAVINTVALTKPFSDTTEYGRMIARQFHLLGDGKPIVQRIGDFREGRRSSLATFESRTRHFDSLTATYRAVPGDITLGMPARIIDNIWESLKKLDKIVPGILHPSSLMYAPEIKFFDTRFPTDRNLETDVEGIFVAGDGAGKSRGIVGAAISGIIAAKGISQKF
ncbi:MAG: NAD(P)/FAD-dependent oxidoreductase [Syntrophales bacterium]|jgi:uncharacterized FAD-dependent dehydrogenase|nr:NAD(P)/FAD-dependent oxidoreductase [Syntrophales bacterium]MDY0044670.1 NAD(P)/FAD-dependent oxidoreductase [Syntrophales bacterium]